MKKYLLFSLSIVLAMLLMTACGSKPKPNNTPTTTNPPVKKLRSGVEVFEEWCVSCHGQKGEGLVGPNLTDAYWIHGNSIEDIMHVIRAGVPEKGMIPYNNLLKEEEIQKVAEYVLSLQGSNPEGGKDPEGNLVE